MLKQASLRQLRSGEITKEMGYLLVAMCRYPRGLGKERRHEFNNELAPTVELLNDFKKFQAAHGHEQGFVKSNYEARFQLSRNAMKRLKELAEEGKKQEIFLFCQCELGERCHRELLLLVAKKEFGAKIGKVFHKYPVFQKRIGEMGREQEITRKLTPELWY